MYYLVTVYMYDNDNETWGAGSRVEEAASAEAAKAIVSASFRDAADSLDIDITSVTARKLTEAETETYIRKYKPPPEDDSDWNFFD